MKANVRHHLFVAPEFGEPLRFSSCIYAHMLQKRMLEGKGAIWDPQVLSVQLFQSNLTCARSEAIQAHAATRMKQSETSYETSEAHLSHNSHFLIVAIVNFQNAKLG